MKLLKLDAAIVLSAWCLCAFSAEPIHQRLTHKDNQRHTQNESGTQMVDRLVKLEWTKHSLKPVDRTEDWEFLRRSTLDILGRLPLPEEYDEFFKKPSEVRRNSWCSYLIEHPEMEPYWGKIWEEIIQGDEENRNSNISRELQEGLSNWKRMIEKLLDDNDSSGLRSALRGESLPIDKRALEGETTMVPLAVHASQAFLGTSIQCAQCHDHMFEPYTQQDFWGLTALFRNTAKGVRPSEVSFKDPKGTEKRAPRSFFGKPVSDKDSIAKLFIESPNFSKAIVNQVWGQLFSQGLNAPHGPGEINDPSKPGNFPALLDSLAKRFVDEGYDQKKIMNWICQSDVYSLKSYGSVPDWEDAKKYFTVASAKPLTSTQLVRIRSQLSHLGRGQHEAFSSQEFREAFPESILAKSDTNHTIHSFLYLTNNKNFTEVLKGIWQDHLKQNPLDKKEAFQFISRYLLGKEMPPEVLAVVMKGNPGPLTPAMMADMTKMLMTSSFFLLNN